jgi:hypothetical protein
VAAAPSGGFGRATFTVPARSDPLRDDPALAHLPSCLRFSAFNTATWQIAVGTPLVLFAEQLGATAGQVGLLTSLVLLLTPLQVLSTVLLPRLGYRRLMLSGWGLRSLLLFVPVVLAALAWGRGERAWMADVLVAAIFLFCFFRSIGMAALLPWFYAIIPPAVRGRYFARESVLIGVASVGVLVLCTASYACLPAYPALMVQYAAAMAGSVVSWLALRRLPPGPTPAAASLRSVLAGTPLLFLVPSEFRRYLLISLVYWAVATPVPVFVAYYLKSQAGYASAWIMALELVRYVGMVAAARFIGQKIDRAGARPYLLAALVLYLGVAAFWLLRLHGHLDSGLGVAAAYLAYGLANTGWAVGNSHYLPKVATGADHTLRLAVYGAATALAGGVATLAWGWALRSSGGGAGIDRGGFEALFGGLLLGAGLTSWLLSRRPEPGADAAEPLIVHNTLLRPWQAVVYLSTLGETVPSVPEAQSDRSAP